MFEFMRGDSSVKCAVLFKELPAFAAAGAVSLFSKQIRPPLRSYDASDENDPSETFRSAITLGGNY